MPALLASLPMKTQRPQEDERQTPEDLASACRPLVRVRILNPRFTESAPFVDALREGARARAALPQGEARGARALLHFRTWRPQRRGRRTSHPPLARALLRALRMRLWLLRPVEGDSLWDPWYDKAFGFVVRAEAARSMPRDGRVQRGQGSERCSEKHHSAEVLEHLVHEPEAREHHEPLAELDRLLEQRHVTVGHGHGGR